MCVGGLFVRAIICSVSTVTLTLFIQFSYLLGPTLVPFLQHSILTLSPYYANLKPNELHLFLPAPLTLLNQNQHSILAYLSFSHSS